jgi:hypothetical protein
VQKGAIEALRAAPPADSIILDVDERGPVAAKRYPGQRASAVEARPAQRAKQEIDDGHGRRAKGDVFGALWETTGACWTQCYPRRTKQHFMDFLSGVDEHLPADKPRIYAILDHLDHLDMHHCADLLLVQIHHPRSRVRLSTQVRRLPHPARTLVDDAALLGARRSALRDLA